MGKPSQFHFKRNSKLRLYVLMSLLNLMKVKTDESCADKLEKIPVLISAQRLKNQTTHQQAKR